MGEFSLEIREKTKYYSSPSESALLLLHCFINIKLHLINNFKDNCKFPEVLFFKIGLTLSHIFLEYKKLYFSKSAKNAYFLYRKF
jgi:hypothetical protein